MAPLTLTLVRTPDILADLGGARGAASRPVLIGFAAETGDPVARGRDKLRRKGVDLIVANDITGRTPASTAISMPPRWSAPTAARPFRRPQGRAGSANPRPRRAPARAADEQPVDRARSRASALLSGAGVHRHQPRSGLAPNVSDSAGARRSASRRHGRAWRRARPRSAAPAHPGGGIPGSRDAEKRCAERGRRPGAASVRLVRSPAEVLPQSAPRSATARAASCTARTHADRVRRRQPGRRPDVRRRGAGRRRGHRRACRSSAAPASC